ncbi:MAG: hypothetical protein EBS39_06085 [Gammaproteobacteria bacterium]|nr:hypothetical protein [Gammaproteobacteria bacterium]
MATVFAQDTFDEVFGQMIAGALPLAGVNAEAAVALVARDILGTEDVHTVSVREPVLKRILYFAVPSRLLTSVPSFALPLTAALPGHPAHRGPGAYVLTHANRSVAALFTGTQLRLLFNDRDIIAETIAEQGLPEFDVGEVQDGYPLTSSYAALQQRVDTTSERVTRVAGVVTLAAGLIYLGSQLATGYYQSKLDAISDRKELALQRFTSDLSLNSKLAEQISMVQLVASNTVRTGGWIERYRQEGSKEAFEVMVPEWVTRDIVQSFGSEAKAELAGDGMVRVRRGKITEKGTVAGASEAASSAGSNR